MKKKVFSFLLQKTLSVWKSPKAIKIFAVQKRTETRQLGDDGREFLFKISYFRDREKIASRK